MNQNCDFGLPNARGIKATVKCHNSKSYTRYTGKETSLYDVDGSKWFDLLINIRFYKHVTKKRPPD